MLDVKDASQKTRAFVRTIAAEHEAAMLEQQGITIERAIIMALLVSLFDAYRDEWQATVKRAGLEHEAAVAVELMKAEGYTNDPICGLPGQEPYFAKVGEKKATCYEMSMNGLMPLSAYFVNKVQESIDIAAKVGELVAKQEEVERGRTSAVEVPQDS